MIFTEFVGTLLTDCVSHRLLLIHDIWLNFQRMDKQVSQLEIKIKRNGIMFKL